MKKGLLISAASIVALAFIVGYMAFLQKVPAGYVGVKVYLLGTSKGVSAERLGVGRYWIGWNEELHKFPTFVQNYVWTHDKTEQSPQNEEIVFQDMNGLVIRTDLGCAYRIKDAKAPDLFQLYKKDLNQFTNVILRSAIRDAFIRLGSQLDISEIYGKGKAELLKNVISLVHSEFAEYLEEFNLYLVGSMRLPESVQKALDEKIAATQRAIQRENEVAEAKAQANKDVAIAEGVARATLAKAKATAEANDLIARSLTVPLIEQNRINKWDGKLPQMVTSGAGVFATLGGK